jgi:hypothetical protein
MAQLLMLSNRMTSVQVKGSAIMLFACAKSAKEEYKSAVCKYKRVFQNPKHIQVHTPAYFQSNLFPHFTYHPSITWPPCPP